MSSVLHAGGSSGTFQRPKEQREALAHGSCGELAAQFRMCPGMPLLQLCMRECWRPKADLEVSNPTLEVFCHCAMATSAPLLAKEGKGHSKAFSRQKEQGLVVDFD